MSSTRNPNSSTASRGSRLLSGRYPPAGSSPIADRIRQRRGARGLTPLDVNLLHFPEAAAGYNDLLGALRTGGRLPGDVREIMILRIAALNNASFEWVQHEPLGRCENLSTGQLYAIRDTQTPLPPMAGLFSDLQLTALEFTDSVTRTEGLSALEVARSGDGYTSPKFTIDLGNRYKIELRQWLGGNPSLAGDQVLEDAVEGSYAEACFVISAYNMVSRFLVSTDVGGISGSGVPWPLERHELEIPVPSYPSSTHTHTIHTVVLKHISSNGVDEPEPEWLVFANSLLTSLEMWNYVVPYFITGKGGSGSPTNTKKYNLILHDQRGHGRSDLPPPPPPGAEDDRRTTIPLLAQDIQALLLSPEIRTLIDGSSTSESLKSVKAVVGVSQGGAAALALAALNSGKHRKVKSVVACDTSARTAPGNKAAWAERVRLVYGAEGSSDIIGDVSNASKGNAYALKVGMGDLAKATLPRWFPAGSSLSTSRRAFVERMVEQTSVEGLVAGAQALGDFDLLPSLYSSLGGAGVEKALLVAGSLDGGGKVGAGLQKLKADWEEQEGMGKVEYREIEGSGHLPMVDKPEAWVESVGGWLESF